MTSSTAFFVIVPSCFLVKTCFLPALPSSAAQPWDFEILGWVLSAVLLFFVNFSHETPLSQGLVVPGSACANVFHSNTHVQLNDARRGKESWPLCLYAFGGSSFRGVSVWFFSPSRTLLNSFFHFFVLYFCRRGMLRNGSSSDIALSFHYKRYHQHLHPLFCTAFHPVRARGGWSRSPFLECYLCQVVQNRSCPIIFRFSVLLLNVFVCTTK